MSDDKRITFIPSGRGKAQCPPDPNYPDGIAIPAPADAEIACIVELPYPAPECGWFEVECSTCGLMVVVTAAGRADDPVSVSIPCAITKRVTGAVQ